MKKKLLFLLLLFVGFAIFVIVQFFVLRGGNKEGRLKVISSPTANILIDGEPSGKTPFEASFDAGEYEISLVPDEQTASGSATWKGRVTVYPGTQTFVSREISQNELASSGVIITISEVEGGTEDNVGSIEVETEPDGSIVFLDDEEQGIAPLILEDVPEGDHELSVFSPGFFRRSQKIKVREGFIVSAKYDLAVDQTHQTVELEEDDEATDEADLEDSEESEETDSETANEEPAEDSLIISINQTSTGWLRVRSEASVSSDELGRVEPGDQFEVLDEDAGWYQIEFTDGENGWISGTYTTEVE